MEDEISTENVRLKRAYDAVASSDGTRILVDRCWPRGVKKADAAIDQWAKDIAPSAALRIWFGFDSKRWPKFRSRYSAEVRERIEPLDRLRDLARRGPITLVYSARNQIHNNAVVLRELLLASK